MYLGIDLGTSNSAIVSYIDEKRRLLKTVDTGTDVLPSAIYIDRRGHKFFGHRAYEHLFRNPANAVDGFKRQMGTSWKKEFKDSGIVMSAEECSADILRQLIAQARVVHGDVPITGTVITIPAAFNQMQIEATKRAADMAGLEKVALVQEPVAAALASVADSKNKDGLFLIYDIGGGTFDLALVQSVNGEIGIIAHEGINALGGRDFDRIIINSIVRPWLLDTFSLSIDFQKQPKYEKMIRIVRMMAETARKELSKAEEATIYVSDEDLRITDDDGQDIYIEIPITRKQYEPLISDNLDETIELSRKILKENGFQSDDLDKLIFIGGPSSTHALKNIIPHELGLSADTTGIDPMTAVAVGAAIFCEGVNWQDIDKGRKKSRERAQSSGRINIQYDYESRTAKDCARIRIKPQDDVADAGYEIQIDSTEGWTSGRSSLTDTITLELPLDNDGDNRFRAMVFASNGDLVTDATTEIVITRVPAVASSLKLTHSLSAIITVGDDEEKENILHIFADKGQSLPAKGAAASFCSARNLSNVDDTLTVEIYQQPNKVNAIPGEPNLFIGAIKIRREMLEKDIEIGDPLTILWEVDESGVCKISVQVDETKEIYGGKFYSSELGHRSYEGKDGERLVADMLRDANQEMKDAEKISDTAGLDMRQHRNTIKELAGQAQNAADGEERRAIYEKVRDTRQKIAEYRNDPKNIKNSLQTKLSDIIENFDSACRDDADEESSERFDKLAEQAKDELEHGDGDYSDVKRCVEEMTMLVWRELMSNPRFIKGGFDYFAQQRHTAMDTIKHDELVEQGEDAIRNGDVNALKNIYIELARNQIGTISGAGIPAKISDIMKR